MDKQVGEAGMVARWYASATPCWVASTQQAPNSGASWYPTDRSTSVSQASKTSLPR